MGDVVRPDRSGERHRHEHNEQEPEREGNLVPAQAARSQLPGTDSDGVLALSNGLEPCLLRVRDACGLSGHGERLYGRREGAGAPSR